MSNSSSHHSFDNSQFIHSVLSNNKKWAQSKKWEDPTFFKRLEKKQTPSILWIGCSDSRVPPNEICGLGPGEVFVHRNIANVVLSNDLSINSVIQYSVCHLKVRHIIVCGHYGCGGIEASQSQEVYGAPIDTWIAHIKKGLLKTDSLRTVLGPKSESQKLRVLVENNVLNSLLTLGQLQIIQDAWKRNQCIQLHGWVYDLSTGYLKDLHFTMSSQSDLNRLIRAVESKKSLLDWSQRLICHPILHCEHRNDNEKEKRLNATMSR